MCYYCILTCSIHPSISWISKTHPSSPDVPFFPMFTHMMDGILTLPIQPHQNGGSWLLGHYSYFPGFPSQVSNWFMVLRRQGLLPKIISGTSGGAAIAAYVCCRTDGELLGSEAGAGGAKRLREMVGEFLINFRQQKRKQVIRGKKTYHIYDSLKLCIYGFIDLSIYRSTIYRSIYLHLSLFIFIAFICSY